MPVPSLMGRWPEIWRRWRGHPEIAPELWREALDQLACTRALSESECLRLHALVLQFLRAKRFEGAAGLDVTDRMRVQIALQACLLILNLGMDCYAGWHAVILYPGDFVVHKEEMDDDGVVHQWTEELAGESWQQGPVILSWDSVTRPEPGINIVLHEFAHKLDMLDGIANGCPPLPPGISAMAWQQDFQEAYGHFCETLENGRPEKIDAYAAESPAEFFAVLSELFFIEPAAVLADYPAVYRQLRAFYRQDPHASLETA